MAELAMKSCRSPCTIAGETDLDIRSCSEFGVHETVAGNAWFCSGQKVKEPRVTPLLPGVTGREAHVYTWDIVLYLLHRKIYWP